MEESNHRREETKEPKQRLLLLLEIKSPKSATFRRGGLMLYKKSESLK